MTMIPDPALGRREVTEGVHRRRYGLAFGHIVVPPGADRTRYIDACARRWVVDVMLDDGTLLAGCRLSSAVASNYDGIKRLPRFPPEDSTQAGREALGAGVVVGFRGGNIDEPIVLGCLFPPDANFQVVSEDEAVMRHETEAAIVETSSDGRGNVLVKVRGRTGGAVDGTGSLTVDVQGATAGQGVLRIRTTGNVLFEHPTGVEFRLGSEEAAEPFVLGEMLRQFLSDLIDLIIQHNHTAPNGPTTAPIHPTLGSLAALQRSPLNDRLVLSDWVFSEKAPAG